MNDLNDVFDLDIEESQAEKIIANRDYENEINKMNKVKFKKI
jgi:hypothetical protein